MILCCGEARIDMLPCLSADAQPAFAPHPGGSAFHTALALGRLGAPAGFFGRLSTDGFGRVLAEALATAQVDISLAPRSARPTPLGFCTGAGSAEACFYEAGGTAPDDFALPALPDGVGALFIAGAALASEPGGGVFEALALREAPRRLVMLDADIRPARIADPAAFRGRLARLIAVADIVKLSDDDMRWLRGTGDLAGQAEALLAAGPRLVVISEGARGATGYLPGGAAVFVPAPSVTVADTEGAGDTFNAGLLAALHRAGLSGKVAARGLGAAAVRSAINLGVHAAAVTVSRRGANPPFARELVS